MFQVRKKGRFEVLVVNPHFRKKGIAKKLVSEGFTWFKKNKITRFAVTTHASDVVANSFWKRGGFKPYNIGYEK